MNFFLLITALFASSCVWSNSNLKTEFLNHLNVKNYYISKKWDQRDKNWYYICDQESGVITNKIKIEVNKDKQSIRFYFMEPDHPFFKITKVIKKNKNKYTVYFNKDANFFFNVEFLDNGLSLWEYHSPSEDETSENFIDESFGLISFEDRPQIKIISECRD